LQEARKAGWNARHEHEKPRGNLGGRILGAEIRAVGAREAAQKANREADRAEADA